MAGLRKTYFRHIYTWSDHGVSGDSPGWDILASSCPEDRSLLPELEKLGAFARPDWEGGIPVEMMQYSPVCGFVKMRARRVYSGNRGRRNKVVCMYQPKDKPRDPGEYLIPGDYWGDREQGLMLSELELDIPAWDKASLLKKTGIRTCLPDLMRLVYKTVFGEISSLNLVFSEWKEEEFARRSREVMFLIHRMLSPCLRERAGYVSFSRKRVKGLSFVFSREPLQKMYFRPEDDAEKQGTSLSGGEKEELEKYFFDSLAGEYKRDSKDFDLFLEEADAFLSGRSISADQLKKLEWLYLVMRGMKKEEPREAYIRDHIPDLLYWSGTDPEYIEVTDLIRNRISYEDMPDQVRIQYIKTLAAKSSRTSMTLTAEEIERVIPESWAEEGRREEVLAMIKEKNEGLYCFLLGIPMEAAEPVSYISQPETVRMKKEPLSRLTERGTAKTGKTRKKEVLEKVMDKSNQVNTLMERKREDRSARTAQIRSLEEDRGLLPYIITGLVSGFITGCLLYLAHYTIRLGHWKIAPCLLGIWLLLQFNMWYLLRQKEDNKPYFYAGGLAVIEGLIVEIAVWSFPTQKMRLYFLAVLGAATLLIQFYGIIKMTVGKKGEGGD